MHERSAYAQKVKGLRAKLYNKQRHAEKIQMKKTCVGCWFCRREVAGWRRGGGTRGMRCA